MNSYGGYSSYSSAVQSTFN